MLGTMTHLCGWQQVRFTLYLYSTTYLSLWLNHFTQTLYVCRTIDETILVVSSFHSFWTLKFLQVTFCQKTLPYGDGDHWTQSVLMMTVPTYRLVGKIFINPPVPAITSYVRLNRIRNVKKCMCKSYSKSNFIMFQNLVKI